MFFRRTAYLPIQRTYFKSSRLRNEQVRRMSSELKCIEPCPDEKPKCTDRIKKLQTKFQAAEACPVWLKTGSDKFLYMSTIGLAVTGLAYNIYSYVRAILH